MDIDDKSGLQSYDISYESEFYNDQISVKELITNFLWGPSHILLDYSDILLVVLCLRFTHLIIDFSKVQAELLKNLTTIVLGLIQLKIYAEKVGLEKPEHEFSPIINLVVYYTILVIVARFLSVKTSSIVGQTKRILMGVLIVAPLLANEYLIFFHKLSRLTTIRSVLAGLIMRSSSIIMTAKYPLVDTIACVAYLFHPATCILGVWQPMIVIEKRRTARADSMYGQFMNFMQQVFIATKPFLKTIVLLVVYANISDLITFVDSSIDHSLLRMSLTMYLTALEFRTSHYFSGYMSTSLLNLWENPASFPKFIVCEPIKIEFPRSLSEVVRFWNLPMHQWLKLHIFWPSRKHFPNIYVPLGLTYIVSSMLHGFKFHIWAVLLTLGFLTWLEHQLRALLSSRYSACLLSSSCEYNSQSICSRGHRRTPRNSVLVNIINSCFILLAMTHLAYLGCIFVGNSDQASYHDALAIWSEVYFFTHVVSVATYLAIKLIHMS